jgi:exodeoxyribonuclease V gamma subunit
MQLRRDALEEDALSAEEPLDASFSSLEQVPRKLVLAALLSDPQDRAILADPPDWLGLSGKLPPGALGSSAWLDARQSAEAMQSGIGPLGTVEIVRTPQLVQFKHDGIDVSGEIADVLSAEGGRRLWVFDAYAKDERDLDFKARVPLFLRWALLRLQSADEIEVEVCLLLKSPKQMQLRDSYAGWCERFKADPAGRAALRSELAERVFRVLALYGEALVDTCWYFPKTSWAALADDCLDAVSKAWHGADGDWGKGEVEYAPGYAAAFARDVDLPGKLDSLKSTARRLAAAIDLAAPLELAASTTSQGALGHD